jgi:arylsulfatase A-like enzyme
MGYKAVRTRRWKYIHYVDLANADELYDLKTDPYELDNRIGDRKAPLERMKRLLHVSNRSLTVAAQSPMPSRDR